MAVKKNLEKLFFKDIGYDIREVNRDPGTAEKFAENTITRLRDIYGQLWNSEEGPCLAKLVDLKSVPDVGRRRQLFGSVIAQFGKVAHCYYVSGLREYVVSKDSHWASAWVTVGIPFLENRAMIAVSSNGDVIEIGLRKGPNLDRRDSTVLKSLAEIEGWPTLLEKKGAAYRDNNSWWYCVRSSLFMAVDQDGGKIIFELENLQKMVQKYSGSLQSE